MAKRRLTYFSLRGRAEAIRLLLHTGSVDFDDHRVDSIEEWAELKPTLPFGSLPLLIEADGSRIAQSHAILRHLGRTLNSAPPDEDTLVELDTVQEFVSESQEDLWRFNWLRNYYELLEGYGENTLRVRLERLSNCFSRRGGGARREWFGPDFSYVDCAAFCYLDEVDAFFPSLFGRFPDLVDFYARVAKLPKVSAYMASELRPLVFGMGSQGPKVDPRVALGVDAQFVSPWSEPIGLAAIAARQRRY